VPPGSDRGARGDMQFVSFLMAGDVNPRPHYAACAYPGSGLYSLLAWPLALPQDPQLATGRGAEGSHGN
jgi:hypothetical protein